MYAVIFIVTVILIGIVIYDISKKSILRMNGFIGVYLIVVPHVVILTFIFNKINGNIEKFTFLFEFILFFIYVWIKLNINPNYKKDIVNKRLRIMYGGRKLVLYGLYASFIQIIIYIYGLRLFDNIEIPKYIYIADFVVMVILNGVLIINGMLRMIFTSRRLNVLKRVLVAFMSWIPIINIFVMLYACHISKLEFDHELYKVINHNARVDSEVCKTKYPFVLVHGVGFRDLKYINYWGRIPKELIRNGATVYYGNQEAWGTIHYNAHDIKEKILKIISDTGCEKVNVIAHSKGGLDSRYMISMLDMGKYVASLTTMSTPHRGSKVIDTICHVPDGIYKPISNIINRCFRRIGDNNPDFYTASKQFSTSFSKEFNENVIDVEGVYYQSYTSIMKNMFSDFILTIPYFIVKFFEGENDGLVSVDSAKWGEFKGVLSNKSRRGISHGDIIDLRRDDYKGFDIIEKYVLVVSDLKQKGY